MAPQMTLWLEPCTYPIVCIYAYMCLRVCVFPIKVPTEVLTQLTVGGGSGRDSGSTGSHGS